jgi:hypothetical protein
MFAEHRSPRPAAAIKALAGKASIVSGLKNETD